MKVEREVMDELEEVGFSDDAAGSPVRRLRAAALRIMGERDLTI